MLTDIKYSVDVDQVLRFMGCSTKPQYTKQLLNEVEQVIENIEKSTARAVVQEIRLTISKRSQCLHLPQGLHICENSVYEKLKGSNFLLFAVLTLGTESAVEAFPAREKSGIGDLIWDAAGTAALNDAATRLKRELTAKYGLRGLELTPGWSPGESGFPLYLQKIIFALLDTKPLGIKLTEQMMMEPLKSYSMIFGVSKKPTVAAKIIESEDKACRNCVAERCEFREDEKVHQVKVLGKETKILTAKHGENLLELLNRNGIKTANYCGGHHLCGKCIIQLEKPITMEIDKTERELLRTQRAGDKARLACFIKVEQDLWLSIPTEVAVPQIVVGNQGDHPQLDPRVRREKYKLKDSARLYGLAMDIGTTTVAVYLLDMENGALIDVVAFLNPQQPFGHDVITRIAYSLREQDGLQRLNETIVDAINSAIRDLCRRNTLRREDIYEITVAGNTTMVYLLRGVSCQSLASAPYDSVDTTGQRLSAAEIGININPVGDILILPGISAFLGADILAGLCASRMTEDEKINLLLDLGTNGEIVLGNKNRLVACSTAAGPAFEGGRILHGIGGVGGAIDHVDFSGDKLFTTINNQDPLGICGSGVLDLVAELLKSGIVDKTGRMKNKAEMAGVLPDRLAKLLTQRDGQPAFLLDERSGIIFTQKDVREFQLAKGAILAGIHILMRELGIVSNQIETVYLAGGFGNYINVANAEYFGLLPSAFQQKTVLIGNSSGSGAIRALLSDSFYQAMPQAKNLVEYVELALDPDFQIEYIKALDF